MPPPQSLCSKITEDEVAELRARFAGNQADRTAAAATAAASGSSSAASGAKSGKGGGKAAPAAVTNAKSGPAGGGPAAAAAAASADGTATQAASGKEKQNKAKAAGSGGGKGGGGKGGVKEPERSADISRLDLRVGFITKAWRHPDAERWVAAVVLWPLPDCTQLVLQAYVQGRRAAAASPPSLTPAAVAAACS